MEQLITDFDGADETPDGRAVIEEAKAAIAAFQSPPPADDDGGTFEGAVELILYGRFGDERAAKEVASYIAKLAVQSPPPIMGKGLITRADREAAADLIEAYWSTDKDMRALAESYRAGHNSGVWADAFRRYRLSLATPSLPEEMEDAAMKLAAFAQANGYDRFRWTGTVQTSGEESERFACEVTLPGALVPEGMVMVPREPTEEMANRAFSLARMTLPELRRFWSALLATSPASALRIKGEKQ